MHLLKTLITILFLVALGTIILQLNIFDKNILENTTNTIVANSIIQYQNIISKNDNLSNLDKNITGISTKVKNIFNYDNTKLCETTYGSPEGEVVVELYIKNNKIYHKNYYLNDQNEKMYNYHLYDNEYLYSWGENSMPLKIYAPNLISIDQEINPKELDLKRLGIVTGINLICKGYYTSDDFMDPPTDIEFIDTQKKVEEIQDTIENTIKVLDNSAENYINKACEFCYLLPTEELMNSCLQTTNCKK